MRARIPPPPRRSIISRHAELGDARTNAMSVIGRNLRCIISFGQIIIAVIRERERRGKFVYVAAVPLTLIWRRMIDAECADD